jgi:hypothetical protein
MGIIHPWNVFYDRNEIAGQDCVEIYGANKVYFFIKEVKKQFNIEFRIKNETPVEKTTYPKLVKRHVFQRDRRSQFSANKGNMISVPGKGRTDADHALVVAKVVSNRKNQFLRSFHVLLS